MAKKNGPIEPPYEHVIITTGDIKKEYEIIGLVSCVSGRLPDIHWAITYKGYVLSTLKYETSPESNTYSGIDELKKQCARIGGDAVVFCRINSQIQTITNPSQEIHCYYGTDVKIKE